MKQKFKTAGDHRREKFLADEVKFAPVEPLHPAIGVLVRNGTIVYYVTLLGRHVENTNRGVLEALVKGV